MNEEAVEIFDLPHSAARRLAATGAPVFLTVNPVEFHGPHLPLHTDRIISTAINRALHARLLAREPGVPLVLGADLEIGVDPTPGVGTRYTPYPEACRLVTEACRALLELGVRRVVITTFHGAPLHNLAIWEGITLLAKHGVRAVAPLNLLLAMMLDLDTFGYAEALEAIAHPDDREAVRRDLRCDFHAGFLETSLMLHYAPHCVDSSHRTMAPCPSVTPDASFAAAARAARLAGQVPLAKELRYAAWAYGWQKLSPFPGYTGRPHLANPRSGAAFARHMEEMCDTAVEGVFTGARTAPPPIMRWVASATLGGRIVQFPRGSESVG